MGLFDWLKAKPQPKRDTDKAPGMIVLLDALPEFDCAAAEKALGDIEELRVAPKIEIESGEGTLHGSAEFDSHSIGIVGFNQPAPQGVMEKTVEVSNWRAEGRELLESAKAHLVLMHKGGGADVLEKYIALYKLAAVLGGEHLRGVLIEEAWTCAPVSVVREFTDRTKLADHRKFITPIAFYGFVRFNTDEGAWYASKGLHMFDVPDLVMFGPDEDPMDVLDMMMNIFLYVKTKGARIAAGHTFQIADDAFFKFSELETDNAYLDYLKGAGKTLQLKRISKDEIGKKGDDQ